MIVELELKVDKYHLLIALEEEKVVISKVRRKIYLRSGLLKSLFRRLWRGVRRVRPPLSDDVFNVNDTAPSIRSCRTKVD